MNNSNVSEQLNDIKELITSNKTFFDDIKERFKDAFFSYFITLMIVLNWKFIVTVLISKPDVSESVIKTANTYIEPFSGFVSIYHRFGHPSPIVLSFVISVFMVVAYPWISFFFQYVRKIWFYYMNRILMQDFPSRDDYSRVMNEVSALRTHVANLEKNRFSEIKYIAEDVIKEPKLKHKHRITFSVLVASKGSSFLQDEIGISPYNHENSLEKYNGPISQDRLRIVIKNIINDIYLVASINDIVLQSEKFKRSGKSTLIINHEGKPDYVSDTVASTSHFLMRSTLEKDDFLYVDIQP